MDKSRTHSINAGVGTWLPKLSTIARLLVRPPPTHLRRATSPSGGDSFLALALSPRSPLAANPPVLLHRFMPQRIDQRFIAPEQMLDPAAVAGEGSGAS